MSIREIQEKLISGQTQFYGFDVRIHTGDPSGFYSSEDKRHRAYITGPLFNAVVATPPSIQAKTLKEFCWDVAVWLCENKPIEEKVITKNKKPYERLA